VDVCVGERGDVIGQSRQCVVRIDHFERMVDIWQVFAGGDVEEGVFSRFLIHSLLNY
jgi:hypothetical protein